MFCDMKELLA